MLDKFIICGHRGTKFNHVPENTLMSIGLALKLGVNMIEIDIRRCADSEELVVMHDSTLDRTTDGHGPVSEKKLEELRALKTKGGEQLPTLREALEFIKGRAAVNIEIKDSGTSASLWKILKIYIEGKHWPPKLFLVSSFDVTELKKFHKIAPSVRVGILLGRKSKNYTKHYGRFDSNLVTGSGAWSVNLEYCLIDKKIIRFFHSRGVKILAWTVNSRRHIKKMLRLGVDGIISDYPHRVIELLNYKNKRN